MSNLDERVERAWRRVCTHAGEAFDTARGLLVTHEVVGNGIWFYRLAVSLYSAPTLMASTTIGGSSVPSSTGGEPNGN